MERLLYTKMGAPIREVGGNLFDKAGVQVGRLDGETVFASDGRYAATLTGGRLVYLSAQRGRISYSFAPTRIRASAAASMIASVILGEEPFVRK
ncbi:hypothetical protein Caci_8628 [Catenulispora acidiphila DSM 44928]|uniref:Uncharacterized protein n=1 Tax=Catenulispora acidiphila (strain DSM 44928 / JCM 14897 / NBRC 102108 / NRRL B-24433 / ID139908) TaxID=479433 RepID=C7Q0B1_CATAD|nr:hypothetical protein [Catenulispora acidiphila]ACU77444.1 hypothetical protein Caci_8628 [Catenulispora acidiphila DSM 44928]